MHRRRFLGIVAAGPAVGSGCMGVGMGASVDLVVVNETTTAVTAAIEIGGTIAPEGTPPAGRAKTPIGRDEVHYGERLSIDADERRVIRGAVESGDGPLPTGVTVDLEGGRSVRGPVRLGPTAGGTTIVVIVEPDGIHVDTRKSSS